ncbi:substrate-binding periplasmic protein [Dongia sp.]|uniref:substrate-binding periplasmic protein n=1 Tax=Dongia sp. TaxID=1977262 RepID=UPI0035AFD352
MATVELGPMSHFGQGVDADVLKELARRSGCSFEIAEVPRIDIWPGIEDGRIDLATSQISTPQRAKLAHFVTYFGFKNMMVVPAAKGASPADFPTFVARKSAKLGLVRGYRYGNFYDYHLKSLLGDARVIEFATHQDLYAALEQGRVQAILAASMTYYYFLKSTQREKFKLVDASPAPPTPSGVALSRRTFSGAQADNWLRLIEEMRIDGTMHRLAAGHIAAEALPQLAEY